MDSSVLQIKPTDKGPIRGCRGGSAPRAWLAFHPGRRHFRANSAWSQGRAHESVVRTAYGTAHVPFSNCPLAKFCKTWPMDNGDGRGDQAGRWPLKFGPGPTVARMVS